MEFNNKSFIIGVNLRDIQNPATSPHVFVEVVLIDKSNDVLHPLLYQLNADALAQHESRSSLYHPGIMTLQDNSFAMVGEVLSFDKAKKMIHLTNNMTVSYKHLIIASGLKQTILGSSYEEDLSGGVHALWEALRIRKNISDSMIFPELNHLGFNRRKKSYQTRQRIARDIPIKNIQNILPPKLNDSKSLEMMLGGSEKRLYELQL